MKPNYFNIQIPTGASSFEVGSRSQRLQGGGSAWCVYEGLH